MTNTERRPETITPYARRALRVSEAQAALGLGKTSIYALMKEGRLASVRVRGARLIPVEAIEALLAARS